MNETLKIKKGYWQNLTVAKRRACVQSVLSPFKDGRLFKAEEVTKEIKRTYKDHYYFTREMTIGVGHMLAGLGFVKGSIPEKRKSCCLWKWGKPREKSADEYTGPKFADAHDKPKPTLADAYDKPAPTPTVITMETPGGAKTPAEMALFRLEDYLMDKAQEARIHQNEKDEMENYYKGRKVMAKEAATMLRHFRRLELKLAEGGNHS